MGGYRRSAAVHCELSGGKTGVGFFVPPPAPPLSAGYPWAGWHSAPHNHLSSAPLLSSPGFSCSPSFSPSYSLQFVSESVSHAPPAVFNPISALILCPASITFAYVM